MMSVEHFIALLVAIFACSGFWEFIKYLIATNRKKNTASENAELAILHEMLYPKLEECILEGKVGIEEFDRIDNLYQPYSQLGGNGTVQRRYDMVNKLPRVDDHHIKPL